MSELKDSSVSLGLIGVSKIKILAAYVRRRQTAFSFFFRFTLLLLVPSPKHCGLVVALSRLQCLRWYAEPTSAMDSSRHSSCCSPRNYRLAVMGSLLLCLAASNALVLSRSSSSIAASASAGSRIQPLVASGCTRCSGRTRATSATMALGRNSYRSRPGPGKQGRARRSGCGGTPGGADGRPGVRARARRASFGESAVSTRRRGGGEPLGFFDVGDVVWGVSKQQRSAGERGAGFGKQYKPTRTAGGTFTARGVLCFDTCTVRWPFQTAPVCCSREQDVTPSTRDSLSTTPGCELCPHHTPTEQWHTRVCRISWLGFVSRCSWPSAWCCFLKCRRNTPIPCLFRSTPRTIFLCSRSSAAVVAAAAAGWFKNNSTGFVTIHPESCLFCCILEPRREDARRYFLRSYGSPCFNLNVTPAYRARCQDP